MRIWSKRMASAFSLLTPCFRMRDRFAEGQFPQPLFRTRQIGWMNKAHLLCLKTDLNQIQWHAHLEVVVHAKAALLSTRSSAQTYKYLIYRCHACTPYIPLWFLQGYRPEIPTATQRGHSVAASTRCERKRMSTPFEISPFRRSKIPPPAGGAGFTAPGVSCLNSTLAHLAPRRHLQGNRI